MQVIKRSGKLQDFNEGKILTSIMNSSDEINQPLNQGDIACVKERILGRVNSLKKDKVMSQEIFKIIYEELINLGFSDVAHIYKVGSERK